MSLNCSECRDGFYEFPDSSGEVCQRTYYRTCLVTRRSLCLFIFSIFSFLTCLPVKVRLSLGVLLQFWLDSVLGATSDSLIQMSKKSNSAETTLTTCSQNWGINRVLLPISIWFSFQFAGFHVANRAVTRLLLLRRCMKCFSVFLHRYSRARPSIGRSGQVITACACRSFYDARGRSAVRAQPWLLQRLLGLGLCRTLCAGA